MKKFMINLKASRLTLISLNQACTSLNDNAAVLDGLSLILSSSLKKEGRNLLLEILLKGESVFLWKNIIILNTVTMMMHVGLDLSQAIDLLTNDHSPGRYASAAIQCSGNVNPICNEVQPPASRQGSGVAEPELPDWELCHGKNYY